MNNEAIKGLLEKFCNYLEDENGYLLFEYDDTSGESCIGLSINESINGFLKQNERHAEWNKLQKQIEQDKPKPFSSDWWYTMWDCAADEYKIDLARFCLIRHEIAEQREKQEAEKDDDSEYARLMSDSMGYTPEDKEYGKG